MPDRIFDLQDRTAAYARQVRAFVKKLPRTAANIEDIPQLIRSSGSVAANYIEANEALGKGDFLMRVRICLKEAKESRLWLDLIDTAGNFSLNSEKALLMDEAGQFVRMFSTMVRKVSKKFDK